MVLLIFCFCAVAYRHKRYCNYAAFVNYDGQTITQRKRNVKIRKQLL